MSKPCRDCPEGSKRKTPYPGPRCSTCWRKEVKRRQAASHEKRVQNTYGLGEGEYAQLYAFQGGRCALCRIASGKTKRLAVDHDHQSGTVRGELCSVCNRMLGHGRDDPEFFRRAVRYLFFPPYQAMKEGWQGWYD